MKLFSTLCFGLIVSSCSATSSFEKVAEIGSEKLKEISGMDFSRKHKNVFWTHNDSGDTATLFALGVDGKKRAEFEIQSEVGDWEDISLAPCLDSEKDCLYIADTGNKKGKRDQLQIIVIEEPDTLEAKTLTPQKILTFQSQGENFESLAFDEGRKQFYLLNKVGRRFDPLDGKKGRIKLFVLKVGESKLSQLALFDFSQVAGLDHQDSLVTAADFDPSRDLLLIGTYGKAYEVKVSDFDTFSSSAIVHALPALEKAEAMAYNGKDIFVTSEGKNPPLYRLKR